MTEASARNSEAAAPPTQASMPEISTRNSLPSCVIPLLSHPQSVFTGWCSLRRAIFGRTGRPSILQSLKNQPVLASDSTYPLLVRLDSITATASMPSKVSLPRINRDGASCSALVHRPIKQKRTHKIFRSSSGQKSFSPGR